jgi:hypothetical protein
VGGENRPAGLVQGVKLEDWGRGRADRAACPQQLVELLDSGIKDLAAAA